METRKDEKKSKFRIAALEERIAPKISPVTTTTQVNGGGNTPNGNANGVPTVKGDRPGNDGRERAGCACEAALGFPNDRAMRNLALLYGGAPQRIAPVFALGLRAPE